MERTRCTEMHGNARFWPAAGTASSVMFHRRRSAGLSDDSTALTTGAGAHQSTWPIVPRKVAKWQVAHECAKRTKRPKLARNCPKRRPRQGLGGRRVAGNSSDQQLATDH